MVTNIQNAACLRKRIPLYNKQRLSNIWAQFTKKLSNAEAELKTSVAYKKKRVYQSKFITRKKFMSSSAHFKFANISYLL